MALPLLALGAAARCQSSSAFITSIRQFRNGYALDGIVWNDERHTALFAKQSAKKPFPDGEPPAADNSAVLRLSGNTDAEIVLHAFFVLSEGRCVASLGIRTKRWRFDGVFRKTF